MNGIWHIIIVRGHGWIIGSGKIRIDPFGISVGRVSVEVRNAAVRHVSGLIVWGSMRNWHTEGRTRRLLFLSIPISGYPCDSAYFICVSRLWNIYFTSSPVIGFFKWEVKFVVFQIWNNNLCLYG